MFRGRSISKGLCIAGLLMAIVAAVAPAAYGGEGIAVDDPAAAVPAAGDEVTEVTDSAPSVEEVTSAAGSATNDQSAVEVTTETVEEVAAPVVETTSVRSSTSPTTTVESAAADVTSTADEAGTGLPASSGTTSSATATGSAGGTSDANGASGSSATAVSTSPQQGKSAMSTAWDGPATRAPFRSTPRAFVMAATHGPEKLLDELLGIGNTVGVDDVKGVRVTSARGEAEEPAASGAPAPAPLAFTGIAVGAFLAIGVVLLMAGTGVRSAGRVSAAS